MAPVPFQSGGCPITTGLSPDANGYAALADRLAERSRISDWACDGPQPTSSGSLGSVLDALESLRSERGSNQLITAAPRLLCGIGVFDRVLWSSVSGSLWVPEALYVSTVADGAVREIDDELRQKIPLSAPLVEAEVVRRRVPALVTGASHEPRAQRRLVQTMGTQDYVVAPVVVMGSVIGLLHADRRPGKAPVCDADRDLLRLFSDGIGVLYERAVLQQRADEQRRSVAEVCDAAMRALTRLDAAPIADLEAPAVDPLHRLQHQSGARLDESRRSGRLVSLTEREREVLTLLASGCTNSQIADCLTVAESTVKSHVKHILRKLDVVNRAAAIAFYLREIRVDEGRSR